MTAPWVETTLPTLLSRYDLKDIYNADEFGLFYQCLPGKTYHFTNEKCVGGKNSKVRLTGMAAGNAFGERLEMFVIGKSAKPRCFKGAKSIPCRYRNQKKSWMDSELFEDWVRELDRKFGAQKRKIALVIDNCPAHPEVTGLGWVELIFLPPNTTSITQPMDQGIIRSLKAKYRSLAVKKQIMSLEKNKELPKFTILTAMTMLRQSWDSIPNQTFTNCFKKARMSTEAAERVLNDQDDPFAGLDIEENIVKELETDLEKLKENFAIDYRLSADQLVDLDAQTSISGSRSDADILAEVSGSNVITTDEESDTEEPNESDIPLRKPSTNDVVAALNTLEELSVFMKFGNNLLHGLKDVNKAIELESLSSKKQANIEEFFRRT